MSASTSAVAVTVFCFQKKNVVRYHGPDILVLDGRTQKKILDIALPNGLENGVHQLVKVALSSMIALFGTYQIAANGVAQSIWSLASIMGLAMAPVYTMVIGQCMGARLLFSAQFGLYLGWGVIGVAIGMSMDLVFRGVIFIWRYKSQKWTQFQLV